MPIYRHINAGAVFAYSPGNLQDARDRYTITGAPTVIDSPYGPALRFTAADFITFGSEEEYNLRFDSGAQDFSIVAWIRITEAVAIVFNKGDGLDDGWILSFSAGVVRMSVNAIDVESAAGVLADGLWHCIAAVVDRSGNAQVYVDGQASGSPVAIGGEVMATTGAPVMGYDDDIYAVVVFDRILTAAEILNFATHKTF